MGSGIEFEHSMQKGLSTTGVCQFEKNVGLIRREFDT